MKYDNIIAIDPDVYKSGVAFLKPSTRQLEVSNLEFPLLLDYLQHAKTLVVVVEAGWITQANWHLRRGDNARIASAKGNSTGRNHETGRKIVEMCKHYGIEVIEHTPLRKCWCGKDGKITHKELESFTGIIGRTNQDGRDAALLAWCYANLPIVIRST
jgi:predicted nuclease with RNAse H fold